MTPEQKMFLEDRLRKAVREPPELECLKVLLLQVGGDSIVAPSKFDRDTPALLGSGRLMSGPIIMKRMKSRMCHRNVGALWKACEQDVVAIATGYALSEDGLWRQHSWGLLRDGVLETTVCRLKYFGIVLSSPEADRFAECNPS